CQVEQAIRPIDQHYAVSRLVCLENTHNRGGGSIYPLKNLEEICRLAKTRSLMVHLDGARLWNASMATGIKLSTYARWADSVSVCLSKGLGAPVGSLIAGSKPFIERVHRFRKMFGGGMRQAGILAAAGLYALDHHLERLPEDHKKARQLAQGLARITGITVDPEQVETNIVIFGNQGGMTAPEIAEAMKKKGILIHAIDKSQIRLVTHLDVSLADVKKTLDSFKAVLG
ncbi:MAG TPA: GntG family PLP-dependent aldolase, partial [Thermodesulfobacteriota bacterium]|nr:GntG family PLP-dependent aldolase [Thermodesulfobacteriota bacterium]